MGYKWNLGFVSHIPWKDGKWSDLGVWYVRISEELQAWVLRNGPRENLKLHLYWRKGNILAQDEYCGGYLGLYTCNFFSHARASRNPAAYNPVIFKEVPNAENALFRSTTIGHLLDIPYDQKMSRMIFSFLMTRLIYVPQDKEIWFRVCDKQICCGKWQIAGITGLSVIKSDTSCADTLFCTNALTHGKVRDALEPVNFDVQVIEDIMWLEPHFKRLLIAGVVEVKDPHASQGNVRMKGAVMKGNGTEEQACDVAFNPRPDVDIDVNGMQ